MLPVQDVHVVVACRDYRRLPKVLKLYYAPEKPVIEIAPRKKICLSGGRVLLLDVDIKDVSSGSAKPVGSVRELHGHVLGLYDLKAGNPAGVSRISFRAEDAAFTMELRDDGSLSECSWHCLKPGWDFPVYRNPDGTRFREPASEGGAWTESGDAWGFAQYSWEETH